VLVDSNSVGIRADGTGSTGGIHLSMTDSTSSGNSNAGVNAFTVSGSATSIIFSNNSVSVNNGTGFLADGTGAGVFLNNSIATANTTGLSAVNSGLTFSYRNNGINDNLTNDGTPTNMIALE
jgi:hypothetical protein